MRLFKTFRSMGRKLFGGSPTYDGVGGGRRALAWSVGNPGAVAALLFTQHELRAKSRDLVRRNAWANSALESYVANAIGTGIKPQSMVQDATVREAIQALWRDWTVDADAAGLTDFYGLQALACRAMLEGGEALVRLRYRRPEDGLPVALQLQVLEAEHLPVTLNTTAENGNLIRAGIEFDRLGRRVAYHLYRSHPEDGMLAPMSAQGENAGGLTTVRVDATRPGHGCETAIVRMRAVQVVGDPPSQPVELDTGTDDVAVLQIPIHRQRQMLSLQHLNLERHRQPVLGTPPAQPHDRFPALQHGPAGKRLQPVEIGESR